MGAPDLWQRLKPNFGGTSGARELRLSHWTGPLAQLEIRLPGFNSFAAAAEEAAISRLYGGIHFRAAIERGLEQGACIGKHVTALA